MREERINSPRGLRVGGIGDIGIMVDVELDEERLVGVELCGVGEGEREDLGVREPGPLMGVLERLELRKPICVVDVEGFDTSEVVVKELGLGKRNERGFQ